MMDDANESDSTPEKLAHRLLILILASVHTTTMTGACAFYDLYARPESFQPLREEIEARLREEGGWGKTTLTKMNKVDSFLKESQRISPASSRNIIYHAIT
jgi:cytochrome P450